jgi:pimeloyl-ACP methyl ester carboxylesterase
MRMTRAGSGGPPMVFVHGLACDATDWQAQVDWFKARTTVVVGELPGHGSSPGTPADCTVEAYGVALARAMTESRLPPAILVGHSMGCRVVLEACRAPADDSMHDAQHRTRAGVTRIRTEFGVDRPGACPCARGDRGDAARGGPLPADRTGRGGHRADRRLPRCHAT